MQLTLGFIIKDGLILLGLKKRGFGQGKWNGYGGKVEIGESVEESLVREFKEEVNLVVKNYVKMGQLEFVFPQEKFLVHVFKINGYSGEPRASQEMSWEWFKIKDIPYDKMWVDDKYWLAWLINGKKFTGQFIFGDDSGKQIKDYTLKEI